MAIDRKCAKEIDSLSSAEYLCDRDRGPWAINVTVVTYGVTQNFIPLFIWISAISVTLISSVLLPLHSFYKCTHFLSVNRTLWHIP